MNQDNQTLEAARDRSDRQRQEKRKREEELRERQKALGEKVEKIAKKRAGPGFWEKWGDPIGYAAIGLVVVSLIVINYTGDRRKLSDIPVNEDTYMQAHNEEKGHGYTLAKNEFFEGATLQTAREYMNNNLATKKAYTKCDSSPLDTVSIPDAYNFYKEHPDCKTDEVQRKCASSHVEVPLSVYRNRLCKLDPAEKFEPSVDFLFNCNRKSNNGCKGGYLLSTLNFLRKGFVGKQCWQENTDEKTKDTCPIEKLKECPRHSIADYCNVEGENAIKREIVTHGPVISIMHPYRDFLVYRTGDYSINDERRKLDGLLVVKIIGWEKDADGRSFWLVENLWGPSWGQNGLARVKIGSEDMLLEKYAFTLYPEKTAEKKDIPRVKVAAYLEDE